MAGLEEVVDILSVWMKFLIGVLSRQSLFRRSMGSMTNLTRVHAAHGDGSVPRLPAVLDRHHAYLSGGSTCRPGHDDQAKTLRAKRKSTEAKYSQLSPGRPPDRVRSK